MGVHLVGRERETRAITTALRGVVEDRPVVVLLRGEPGIGKTAVIDHIATGAAADGFTVVRGFCAPVGSTVLPYGPIVGLVADLTRQQPDLIASLSPEVQRSLWPLTGAEQIEVSERNATRLFAGCVELLSSAGRQRPLLAVVEDLHWADPASIDLLSYLARTLRAPVALLLTERDPAAEGTVGAGPSGSPGGTAPGMVGCR